jgi:hypothetical protein
MKKLFIMIVVFSAVTLGLIAESIAHGFAP